MPPPVRIFPTGVFTGGDRARRHVSRILVDRPHSCGVINPSSLQLIKCLSGGTQNAIPLESWGMNKGRFGQPSADGAAFFILIGNPRVGAKECYLLVVISRK